MISIYTDRMISILKSEEEEKDSILVWEWMQSEYGKEETKRLQANVLLNMSSEEEQILVSGPIQILKCDRYVRSLSVSAKFDLKMTTHLFVSRLLLN